MFTLTDGPAPGIHVVRLERPPANAMRLVDIERLRTVLAEAESRRCRVLVFTASGRFFSAGADVNVMRGSGGEVVPVSRLVDLARAMQDAFAALESFPAPTIAAITGFAMGGGLELALACDFRIATKDVRLGLTETRIGLIPGAGGTQRLTRILGKSTATRMILTGEIVTGEEAARLGLVHEATDAAAVTARAMAFATTLSAMPAEALRSAKRCIALAGSDSGYAAEIEETERLHATGETQAAIAAFLDRSR